MQNIMYNEPIKQFTILNVGRNVNLLGIAHEVLFIYRMTYKQLIIFLEGHIGNSGIFVGHQNSRYTKSLLKNVKNKTMELKLTKFLLNPSPSKIII